VTELAALDIADSAELWQDLGFRVEDGACRISGVSHRLGAPGRGVVSWALRGGDQLSELPVGPAPQPEPEPLPQYIPTHPNGVIGLDHVVVATPDLGRTIASFEAAGLTLRRLREAGSPEHPLQQAFFKLGHIVIEVAGPPTPSGTGPASFYGLAFTVVDLAQTAEVLGDRLRPAKVAVQSGRMIATLDWSAGSTVPLAFMSPKPPRQ
jgi:hypothetical protein